MTKTLDELMALSKAAHDGGTPQRAALESAEAELSRLREQVPIAHVVEDVDGRNRRVAFYSMKALYDTPLGTKLYASPPAPSQEKPE